MSHELMYTSVPKGLRTGSMGYCTVAVTQNCPSLLQEKLENLSGYRHLFSPFDLNAKYNPVCLQHVRMSIGGKTYSILSSITDAGIDYSKRSNKFAHHVALEASECPAGNPAWSLAQPEFLQKKWDGDPRTITAGRSAPAGGAGAGVAQAWKQLTGDAGWAGALAEAFQKDPSTPFYLIFDPGTNVLPLFMEAIALLPREKQWQVTFSTYYQAMSADVQCAWRAVARHSPEAQQAVSRKLPRVDLAQAGTAPEGELVHLARTGERLKTASKPASKPQSSPISPVPLPDTFAFADRGGDDGPAEEAPVLLPRPKKPVRKQMSLKTFDEKRADTRQPVEEEEQSKSKLPLFIAVGVFILLLLFGGIVAIVVTLSGGQKEQAQATQPAVQNNGPGNQQGPGQGGQKKAKGEKVGLGRQANDGLNDLENEDPTEKEERRKQEDARLKEEERKREEERRKEEAKKAQTNKGPEQNDNKTIKEKGLLPGQLGTGAIAADPPATVGPTPPVVSVKNPVALNTQSEFIEVVYHKVPDGPPINDGQIISFAKLENDTVRVSFLHEGSIKGQVFMPTRIENTYFFETVENPMRATTGKPIVVGQMDIGNGQLAIKIRTPADYTFVLRYLRANPLLSESISKKLVLHVFVDNDPSKFNAGAMPIVLQVDRSKWPKLSKTGVEPDKTVHQKLDKININWFRQMKSNWADEINSGVEMKVVLGNAESVKYYVPSKGEIPCPDAELRRKAKELRLNLSIVNQNNQITLETTASYTLNYDGKKPPLFQDNDKEAVTKSKQSELESLIKEADALSPTKIELHDVKYVLTVNGKSFLMWQNKPPLAPGLSAPHGLDASGVSK